MGLTFITNKLKSLLLFIVATFRRALCCFRRRRHISFSENDQLTHVGVVSNKTCNEFENWTDWNNDLEIRKPQTVQEHIEYYRRKQALVAQENDDENEQAEKDFFENMAPKITKQTKVLINSTNSEVPSTKQNISLTPENVVYLGNELQEWEDTLGWEGDKVDIDAALKETRRIARERRAWEQQQKRSERNNRPMALGAKIST